MFVSQAVFRVTESSCLRLPQLPAHGSPRCPRSVRVYGGAPATQGKWEIWGVGRGKRRGKKRVHVHCAVTACAMATAAVNAGSLLLKGQSFVLCAAEQGTVGTSRLCWGRS